MAKIALFPSSLYFHASRYFLASSRSISNTALWSGIVFPYLSWASAVTVALRVVASWHFLATSNARSRILSATHSALSFHTSTLKSTRPSITYAEDKNPILHVFLLSEVVRGSPDVCTCDARFASSRLSCGPLPPRNAMKARPAHENPTARASVPCPFRNSHHTKTYGTNKIPATSGQLTRRAGIAASSAIANSACCETGTHDSMPSFQQSALLFACFVTTSRASSREYGPSLFPKWLKYQVRAAFPSPS